MTRSRLLLAKIRLLIWIQRRIIAFRQRKVRRLRQQIQKQDSENIRRINAAPRLINTVVLNGYIYAPPVVRSTREGAQDVVMN